MSLASSLVPEAASRPAPRPWRARPGDACAGFITVGHLFTLTAVMALAAAAFLVVDLRHRIEGYRAANGAGIAGLATLTRCETGPIGSHCVGDFVSSDDRVRRTGIRINGAAEILNWEDGGRTLPPGTKVRAAITDADAAEAWAVDGIPWLSFSWLHLLLLVPIALVAFTTRRVVRGGVLGWRGRRVKWQRRRLRRDRRRLRHQQERVRRGQVG